MASAFMTPSLAHLTSNTKHLGNQRCHLITFWQQEESNTGQEAWTDDFLAVIPALSILQLMVEGFPAMRPRAQSQAYTER